MKKHLIDLGFKKKYCSDKSAYWYQLNIPHKLVHKLHISVDLERKSIIVWCEEPKDFNGRTDHNNVLISKKLTKLNLKKILTFLDYMRK